MLRRSTWLDSGDGYTVYGDNVTISSAVDCPFLRLFTYPRGAVTVNTVDAYGYEPTAIELRNSLSKSRIEMRGRFRIT